MSGVLLNVLLSVIVAGLIHGVQALILEQFVSSSRGTPERPPSTHASNLVY